MSSQEITDQIQTETFEFTGRRGLFFKLLLINLFLTIITLGIYRFWAKTNVRRFIWSNIRFMGDPLEYTGKGSELLLGFLIVLAILFPLGLIYEGIQSLAPPEERALHVGLEIAYYIVIFALIQIGFYRAWRYRMSHTAWRGIRLGLDGSTWTFLKLSLGWSVLTVLTLGIAYPWMAIELWRYQITHTRIGQTAAAFNGLARPLLGPWILVLLPIWLTAVVLVFLGYKSDFDIGRALVYLGSTEEYEPLNLRTVGIALVVTTTVWLVLQFWFGLKLLQHLLAHIFVKDSEFRSNFSIQQPLMVGLLASAMIIGFSGLLTAPIFLFDSELDYWLFPGRTTADKTAEHAKILPFILTFVGLFVAFLSSPLIWTIIFQFELLRKIFTTTTISKPGTMERVIQSASDSQKTGEGLADALDIGGL